MRIALIGNQNCGKTTLFNQLTGSRQHVGNFPGVTVDKKEGPVRGEKDMTVVDLPGIYSLTPYSAEEVVTRDFLIDEKPDCILNILDATTLERNLYLTTQLMDLQMPMILALNMMDEVRHNGTNIDTARMEEELGFYVVPISASKNEGIAELIEKIKKTVGEPLRRRKYVEDDPGTLRREGGDFDPCRGSEMCIRDSLPAAAGGRAGAQEVCRDVRQAGVHGRTFDLYRFTVKGDKAWKLRSSSRSRPSGS